jgi:hypothetical protein
MPIPAAQAAHHMSIDLIRVVYAEQARLDAIPKVEHTLVVDQAHDRRGFGFDNQSFAGLWAQPTPEMPIHDQQIKVLGTQ